MIDTSPYARSDGAQLFAALDERVQDLSMLLANELKWFRGPLHTYLGTDAAGVSVTGLIERYHHAHQACRTLCEATEQLTEQAFRLLEQARALTEPE